MSYHIGIDKVRELGDITLYKLLNELLDEVEDSRVQEIIEEQEVSELFSKG